MKGREEISTPLLLANIVSFQAGWFACVLGAARGWWWLGPLLVAAIAGAWLLVAPRPRGLAVLLALTGIVGLCWDSWLAVLGLIAYPPGPLSPPLAPVWILAMWVSFATTLNVSLRWLRGRSWLAVLVGAVLAPLAYFAGARLGALQLAQPQLALLAQAAGWALLLPALVALARRCDA
jgi:Protein of unknown function (DUF2878)